jgi:hypothetical protein
MTTSRPWVSGPGELLRHGLELLLDDSDLNRRLALIAIDNAVELTIKTYLSLPKRVTRVKLSRKDYEEIADSFPKLLDALEAHASDRLIGVDLADIEWYHRLRNQLYHQGSGLTVERGHVEVYATVAQALFKNLFGHDLPAPVSRDTGLIGRFLSGWVEIERVLQTLAIPHGNQLRTVTFPLMADAALPAALKRSDALEKLNGLRQLRNRVVHNGQVPSQEEVKELERFVRDIKVG